MPARNLRSYLSDSSTLQALTRHAQYLATLQRAWNEIAPVSLAAVSTVGALQQQTLVVFAANGAVASKLRQQLPSLLGKIQKRGYEVTAIRIDVQAAPGRTESPPRKHASLSRNAMERLGELEQGMEASPLKDALQAMIRRHAGSTQNQAPDQEQHPEDQQEYRGKSE